MDTIDLHCPKCRQIAFKFRPERASNKEYICANCGAIVETKDLISIDGKTLLDIMADIVRESFSGIEGFKPKR